MAFRQIDRSFPVGICIQCDETQHMYFRFMFIRVLYSSSVKEIFIPSMNHEQIPTNANDPKSKQNNSGLKKWTQILAGENSSGATTERRIEI